MAGVTWTDRKPTDWLASNGRWYPQSQYPTGWSTSALPPAPGHSKSGAVLSKLRSAGAELFDQFDGATDSAVPTTPPPGVSASPPPRPSSPPPATATAPKPPQAPRRQPGSARADVVSQRTYSRKVPSGPPPPQQLPAPDDGMPAPPGRIRNESAPSSNVPVAAPPPPPMASKPLASGGLEVVAGDLGRVFNTAKKRIAEAIEESAAEQKK